MIESPVISFIGWEGGGEGGVKKGEMKITSLESRYNIPELVQRLICIGLCHSFHRIEIDTSVLKSIFTVK